MSKTPRRILPAATLLPARCGALIDRILEKLMNRRLLVFMGLATLLAVLLLVGCRPVTAPPVAPVQDAGALTVDALRNATYSGIYEEPVTLSDGLYEGEPFVAGGAERPRVEYADGAERYGDLDGDGVDDAVVFLVENSGGTGHFVYVAAQLNRDGQPLDAGAVLIEDRIQVRSATIQDGQVLLDLIVPGPGDGACCPSYKASKRYAVQDGLLAELPSAGEELVKVTAADLEGTEWVLAELAAGQPALAEPSVTLRFDGAQLSGSGGCNNYNADFTLGADNPFVMTVGPIAATMMACPDPVGSQESAYFTALAQVSQWGYYYGDLALYTLGEDGALERLLFAPGGAVTETATTDLDALTAHPWQWVSFADPMEQFDVDSPASYTLAFGEDGIVEIVADCNTAIASYGVDGTDAGSLSMSVAPRTTAACAPDSRSDQFLKLLGGAARYFYRDGQLYIDLFADGGTMVFAPSAAETPAGGAGGAAGNAQAMLAAMLGNLTYSGVLPDRTITLTDGRADYEEEGPGTPFVQLIDSLAAAGDLDGDGSEDAVGLLVDYTTGSADFVYLAARLSTQGEPLEALLLGDRTPVKALTVADGQVIVDFVGPGPSDAACCPAWNARAVFAVEDGRLVERSREQVSKVALADLNGTAWRLMTLGTDQPSLLSDTEITLRVNDGQLSGSAGCNDYNAAISTPEEAPQSLAVGPVAVTARLCDDPLASQEAAYLDRLNKVVAWRYAFGRLALTYKLAGDVFGELIFAP